MDKQILIPLNDSISIFVNRSKSIAISKPSTNPINQVKPSDIKYLYRSNLIILLLVKNNNKDMGYIIINSIGNTVNPPDITLTSESELLCIIVIILNKNSIIVEKIAPIRGL